MIIIVFTVSIYSKHKLNSKCMKISVKFMIIFIQKKLKNMKNISKYDCGLKSTEVLFAIYADADEKNRYTS